MDVRRAKPPLLLGLAVLGAACLAFTVAAAAGFWKQHTSFGDGVYIALLFGGALLCLGRAALVSDHRIAWLAIGVGALFNGLGDLYWVLFLESLENVPYPSLADAFWLAVY